MATVTKDELEELQAETADTTTTTATDETKTYEGKFIGTLVGQATTAKEFEKPYKFILSGDTTGSVDVNASDVVLQTTTTHADSADTADFAGKTNLAARASLADLANLATFALETEKIAKLILTFTGMIEGEGILEHGASVDINIEKINAAGILKIGGLPTGEDADNTDTSKIYIDLEGQHIWVYDTIGGVWIDVFEQVNKTLADHGVRLDALEKLDVDGRLTAVETTAADNATNITALTERVTDVETASAANLESITTNATAITALEKLAIEQGGELAKHETAISDLDTKVTANTASIETLNSKVTTDTGTLSSQIDTNTADIGTLKTRVDSLESSTDAGKLSVELTEIKQDISAIKEVNTNQDTSISALETDIAAVKTSVSDNTANITANKTAITANETAIKANETAIKAIQDNYVTQDTDQVIWGSKTFSVSPTISNGYPKFMLQNSNIDSGINTDSTENSGLNFYDKNGTGYANRVGYIEYQQNALPEDTTTDYTVNQVALTAETQSAEEGAVNGVLGVATTKQGKAYAFAPTPDADDVSNKVATTEWVNASYTTKTEVENTYATKTEVENKAPAYTYGTEDLTAGTSELETGKLYFVYEE